ncbi:MAG: hypothetical protein ACRDTH_08655 [Pseudonocardiaceae bacterium]
MSRAQLAARQTALVAALVTGAEVPDGLDAGHLAITRKALLRKRAREVAAAWPLLATSMGQGWNATFTAWAAKRPSVGSLRDGWDLARDLTAAGRLTPLGQEELAAREVTWRYDGHTTPETTPAARAASGTGWSHRADGRPGMSLLPSTYHRPARRTINHAAADQPWSAR